MNKDNRKEILKIAGDIINKNLEKEKLALKHEENMIAFNGAENQTTAYKKIKEKVEHLEALQSEAREMWREL